MIHVIHVTQCFTSPSFFTLHPTTSQKQGWFLKHKCKHERISHRSNESFMVLTCHSSKRWPEVYPCADTYRSSRSTPHTVGSNHILSFSCEYCSTQQCRGDGYPAAPLLPTTGIVGSGDITDAVSSRLAHVLVPLSSFCSAGEGGIFASNLRHKPRRHQTTLARAALTTLTPTRQSKKKKKNATSSS